MSKKLISLRLQRDPASPSSYNTADGLFRIWLLDDDDDPGDRRWYVNHRDFDQTLHTPGFSTKKEATTWLRDVYAECDDRYFEGVT